MTLKEKIASIDLEQIKDKEKVKVFLEKAEAMSAKDPQKAEELVDKLIAMIVVQKPSATTVKMSKAEAEEKVQSLKKMKNAKVPALDKVKKDVKKQYPDWDDDRVETLAKIRLQALEDRQTSIDAMIENLEKTQMYQGKPTSRANIDYVAPKEPNRVMRQRMLGKDAKTSAITEADELRMTKTKYKRKSPTFGKAGGAKRPYYYEYRMNRRDVDSKVMLAHGGMLHGDEMNPKDYVLIKAKMRLDSNEDVTFVVAKSELNKISRRVAGNVREKAKAFVEVYDDMNDLYQYEFVNVTTTPKDVKNYIQGHNHTHYSIKKVSGTPEYLGEMGDSIAHYGFTVHKTGHYATGGEVVQKYDFYVNGNFDEIVYSTTQLHLAKLWVLKNHKRYDSIDIMDVYGDSIHVEKSDSIHDIDWLFSEEYAKGGSTEDSKFFHAFGNVYYTNMDGEEEIERVDRLVKADSVEEAKEIVTEFVENQIGLYRDDWGDDFISIEDELPFPYIKDGVLNIEEIEFRGYLKSHKKYAKGGSIKSTLRKKFEGYTDEELQIYNGDNTETLKNWNREDAIDEAVATAYEEGYEEGVYAKGGSTASGISVPVDTAVSKEEIDEFVDYVDKFYGKQGIYASDLRGGYTKKEIRSAVMRYLDALGKNRTWGHGDSFDRELVLEYLSAPDMDMDVNDISLFAKGGEVTGHKHVLHIDGQNWFLEKIDSTHFYMSNDPNFRGMAHHIGQHKGEPYYDEVREWLKTTTMAKGGEVETSQRISKDTTYVPNANVKELFVVMKGKTKKLSGTDIVNGVYVKKASFKTKNTASTTNAKQLFDEIVKESKTYDWDVEIGFTEKDIASLLSAGLSESEIKEAFYGSDFSSFIKADTSFGSKTNGILASYGDYQKRQIDRILDNAKNNMFEIGLKYPNFKWDAIIKKYNINPKPVIYKTADNEYEIFVGDGVTIGHTIKRKDYQGKWESEGNEIGNPAVINNYQAEREYFAGFNGGYWGIVTRGKSVADDILKTLLSQSKGFVKDLETYNNGLGGIGGVEVISSKIKFAKGGGVEERIGDFWIYPELDRKKAKEFPYNVTNREGAILYRAVSKKDATLWINERGGIDKFTKYSKGGGVSIPNAEKMFHLPMEMAVYVPSTYDVDKKVSRSEMNARINEVEKYLAETFGGFTSGEKEGGYLSSKNRIVTEKVVPVTAFASKDDFNKKKNQLVNKMAVWAKKWGQEAIGFEFEGDLYYVPQKFKKGGRLTAHYIPQNEIAELKTVFGDTFKGKELLDGAYAKRKPKTPKMVRQYFEDEAFEYASGGLTGMSGNAKLMIEFISADVYEDDYEQGEGKYVNGWNHNEAKGTIVKASELVKWLHDNYYLPEDKNAYALSDGRIFTSMLVDVNNDEASESEKEAWKKGKMKLYTANYSIGVKYVSTTDLDDETLSEMTGIGMYKEGGSVKTAPRTVSRETKTVIDLIKPAEIIHKTNNYLKYLDEDGNYHEMSRDAEGVWHKMMPESKAPRMSRTMFEEEVYEYGDGGGVYDLVLNEGEKIIGYQDNGYYMVFDNVKDSTYYVHPKHGKRLTEEEYLRKEYPRPYGSMGYYYEIKKDGNFYTVEFYNQNGKYHWGKEGFTSKEDAEKYAETYSKFAKGGKTSKKGDVGKSGTQYGYTLKEWEQMAEKNGLLVSPKEWWKSREGKKYTDSFGRTQTIGRYSQDEQQEMMSYGYRIAIGMDLGSNKIPASAKKYVKDNNLSKYAKGGNIGFEELSDKVAARYAGKSVKPEYQDEYGKRYDRSEAKEVGDKVAGMVYWKQQRAKKANGGYAGTGGTMDSSMGDDPMIGGTMASSMFAKGGKLYKKFGKENSKLELFDIDDLDPFERMQYDHFVKSMGKAESLQILINNVEGDYSQLSPKLAEIAEEQYPMDEADEDFRASQYAKGGSVSKLKEGDPVRGKFQYNYTYNNYEPLPLTDWSGNEYDGIIMKTTKSGFYEIKFDGIDEIITFPKSMAEHFIEKSH